MPGLLTYGPGLPGSPVLPANPGRRRRVLVPALLLLIAALLGLYACHQVSQPSEPAQLRDYVLDGARGPSCLRLIIGHDVSGSMSHYATARNSALRQLLEWARTPHTLRSEDEIAVVDFAFEAATQFPPTKVAASPTSASTNVPDGAETLLTPLLHQIDQFLTSDCDSVLILFSDAQLADLPKNFDDGTRVLKEHHIHDIRLLAPGNQIDVPQQWSAAFPSGPPVRFDGLDQDVTAVVIGRTIAELTRQRFTPRAIPVSVP